MIRHPIDPMVLVMVLMLEDVEEYQRSERQAGRDIGWERAVEEWMMENFPGDWMAREWQEALQEALRIRGRGGCTTVILATPSGNRS